MTNSLDEAKRVLEKCKHEILRIDGVVGIGITKEETSENYAITVMVKDEKAKERASRLIPEKIEGFKVIVKVTGTFKAL